MKALEDQQRLRPFLLPGERILWTGRPKRGIAFQLQDLWVLPMLAAIFAIPYLPARYSNDWPWDPVTFALVLGMLCLGANRLVREPWLRRRLLYAVTDKRVIILGGAFRPVLRSHDLGWLPMLDFEQRGPDRGTILIEPSESPVQRRWYAPTIEAEVSEGFRFFRIEKPAFVYDLICRASRDRRAELNRLPADELTG
ncbi:MAG TPA: hypothetical protein VF619_05400 [Allosphingosinicella sp.]|jgi:hypothetical protein